MSAALTVALPRPKGLGFISVFDMGRDQLRRPIEYFDRLGDTFVVDFFGSPLVHSRDPLVFEEIFVKKHKSFRKDELTRGLSLLLGQGLLTADGEPWKKNRRLLQPHFHPTELHSYLRIFQEEAELELAAMPRGEAFDVHRHMSRLTVRIAFRALFGVDATEAADLDGSMRAVMEYFVGIWGTGITVPLWIPTPTNFRFRKARKRLLAAIRQVLDKARSTGLGTSVLGSLLAAHDSGTMDEQQLLDECLTMLTAGHETTALTLSYTLGLLASEPAIQEQVVADIESRPFPGSLDDLRAPSAVGRTIKESLRLFPVAWTVGREALEDVELGGSPVAKGTQIYLHIWSAHRLPRYFDDPDAFRPERWTEALEAGLPKHVYTPFGGGPRVCIGNHFALAEMTIALQVFLRAVRVSGPRPFAPRLLPSVTARPLEPLLMTLENR